MSQRPADSHGDWVLCRLPSESIYNAAEIFLLPQTAAEVLAESRRKAEAEKAAEEEERKQRWAEETAAAKLAASPPAKADLKVTAPELVRHPNEVERVQVIVDDEVWRRRLQQLHAGAQGDADHAKRESLALTEALRPGLLRSVARHLHWRERLAVLDAEMPAFRQATEGVRRALTVAEQLSAPSALQPLLLVGPPGVGKSYYCRRLIDAVGLEYKWLAMDQPSAGTALRGSDRGWGNSTWGCLFENLALGATANPAIVLDEIDKATRRQTSHDIDPLAQLYSALEPETSRRLTDVSLDVELDASLVFYVATANTLRTLDAPLLSRFRVVHIGLESLSPAERYESVQRIANGILDKKGVPWLELSVSPGAVRVLADYSPRVVVHAMDEALGAVLEDGRLRITAEDVEAALGLRSASAPLPAGSKSRARLH